MKIVLDLQGCQALSRYRGIGNYSHSLAKALVQKASNNGHETVLLLNSSLPEGIEEIKNSFGGMVDARNLLIWKCPEVNYQEEWKNKAAELVRERYLYSLNADLVHISSFFESQVIASIGKYYEDIITAVTLYDLIPFINYDVYLSDLKFRKYYLDRLENLRKADLLLAISESVRQEALGTSILRNSNIVTISSDVGSEFSLLEIDRLKNEEFKNRYNIISEYVMCASPVSGDLRKNVENLIRAFGLLDPKLRKHYQLVIVGNYDSEALGRISKLKEELGLDQKEVILTGYVDQEDLILFYNLCKLFVFPSLHEGFGLPILEAMRCGAPVIASNRSSMPGLIGLKEALFDPLSTKEIAAKMTRALTDHEYYERLVYNSEVQEKMYSWNKSAKYTLEAFELLYDKKEQKKKIQIVSNKKSKDFLFNNYGVDGFKLRSLINAIQAIKEVPNNRDEVKSIVEIIGENERMFKRTKDLNLVFHGPLFDSDVASYNRGFLRGLDAKGVYNIMIQPWESKGENDREEIAQEERWFWLKRLLKADVDRNGFCINIVGHYPLLIPNEATDINIALFFEKKWISEKAVEKINFYYDGVIVATNYLKKILIDLGVEKPIQVIAVENWISIAGDIDWCSIADRTIEFCNRMVFSVLRDYPIKLGRKIKVGWVSSWNNKCGIAEYSGFLLNEFEKESTDIVIYKCSSGTIKGDNGNFRVKFCGLSLDFNRYKLPLEEIINDKIDVLVIQFNYALLDFIQLVKHMTFCIENNIKIIIVFHSTATLSQFDREIVLKLKVCTRILVHTLKDVNYLKSYGLIDNVTLFPHGVVNQLSNQMILEARRIRNNIGNNAIVIGSYGFFLPSKGLYQLIGAFKQIIQIFPNSKLILVNAEFPSRDSIKEIERCIAYAKALSLYERIEWHTDFKTNEESLAKMRECDILVFPYQNTNESSSAAVRLGLTSGRPVLTTPIPIFDEVKAVTYQTSGIEDDDIAEGILSFITHSKDHNKIMIKQRRWLLDHDWKKVGKRMQGIIKGLIINSETEDLKVEDAEMVETISKEEDRVLAKCL